MRFAYPGRHSTDRRIRHRHHNPVRPRIQRPLDHPQLLRRNPDNRRRPAHRDRIREIVKVVVIDQPVLGVDEDPRNAFRERNGARDRGTRECQPCACGTRLAGELLAEGGKCS